MPTLVRSAPDAANRLDFAGGRPVMLATLDVPFDTNAVAFALDSAVELGQRLIAGSRRGAECRPIGLRPGPEPDDAAALLAGRARHPVHGDHAHLAGRLTWRNPVHLK